MKLSFEHISKFYGDTAALQQIDLTLGSGVYGLLGPNGAGKTTLMRIMTDLLAPSTGRVLLDGQDIAVMGAAFRKKLGYLPQDFGVYPNFTAEQFLLYIARLRGLSKFEAKRQTDDLLHMVGLEDKKQKKLKGFSGGQRQRIGIARALSLNPRFLVCDEPVSALDVSIQAQILNLLRSLQKDLGLTCMFVGHGLGAVNYVSDRIAVMYLGKIVEIGPAQEVFHHPVHPYTRALIDAVPIADPKKREQKPLLTGEIGSSTNPPSGCRFHPRCPYATESCRQEVPELCSVFPGSSHLAACPYAIAQLTGGAPAYDAKMQQVVVEQKWR